MTVPGSDVACDVAGLPADARVVGALARLQLLAGRCGYRIWLHNAAEDLAELIVFFGLDDALPRAPVSRRDGEAGRTTGRASRSRGRT